MNDCNPTDTLKPFLRLNFATLWVRDQEFQNVGTPTGTVTFKDGAKSIAVVQLSGVPSSIFPTGKAVFTTSQLSQGTHTITVNYGGNGNFNPGASTPVKETIGP